MCTSEEDRNLTKLRAALLADDWAVRFNAGLDLVKLVLSQLEYDEQADANLSPLLRGRGLEPAPYSIRG